MDENILASLKPDGMVALRLGNPQKTKLFDRCPRMDFNSAGVKGITSQSCGLKYMKFEYRKLGYWLLGDLVELPDLGSLCVPGEAEKQQCKLYIHLKSFHIKGPDYYVEGDIFIHSSFSGLQQNWPLLESLDCYVCVQHLKNSKMKSELLQVDNAMRSRVVTPDYSRFMYDDTNPHLLVDMGLADWNNLNNRLPSSLQNAVVQVPLNLHLDDASMVTKKDVEECKHGKHTSSRSSSWL